MNKNDLGLLCICALRYCMGRQTYMPGLITGICKGLLPELSDRDIDVMMMDIEEQKRIKNYGDPTIDRPTWIRWEQAVTKEKERRK